MSTRSMTTVRSRWDDGEWETNATIYRHHDGYLEGHGQWLFDFLNGRKIVNGPGRLAAQLVAALQADDHGPDLVPEGSIMGQEYHYQIDVQFGMSGGTISVTVFEGPMTAFGGGGEECNNQVFSGSVEDFRNFLQKQGEPA